MAHIFCPDAVQNANTYFINPVRWLTSATIMVGMVLFYRAFRAGQLGDASKRSFILVMLLFAIQANTNIFHSLFIILICKAPFEVWRPMHLVFSIGAGSSFVFAVVFFYCRLYKVFKGTAFAMGKWTLRISAIILVYLALQSLGGAIVSSIHYIPTVVTIVSTAYKFVLAFGFWMAFMFIYKLRKIHVFMGSGDVSSNDQEFRNVATKTTLLWFVTISIKLLLNTINQIAINRERQSTRIVVNLLTPIGIFADFLVIFLSYNTFDPFYKRMFGSCHNCCLWIWEKKSPIEQKLAEVASGTSKDTTTDGSTRDTTSTGDKSIVLSVDSAVSGDTHTIETNTAAVQPSAVEISTQ